jgi:hypothetical protein
MARGAPFKPYVYNGTGEDIYRGVAQPSPREIAARLHEEIAAKSPEHADLVAGFERRRAELERAELERAHAALDALQAEPVTEPDPEWYRERAAEDADELAGAGPEPWAPETLFTGAERVLLAPAAAPRVPDPVLALWAAPADELAELNAERDRYQAAMARVPEPDPLPAPPPVTTARRHRPCGYLRGSRGCKAVCGD